MNSIIFIFKKIQRWRWVLAIILIFGASFDAYTSLASSAAKPSFYEIVLIHTDDPVIFIQFFIFLLLIADFGFNKGSNEDSSLTGNFKKTSSSFVYSFIISVIFVFIFIICAVLTTLLIGGDINLSNKWQIMQYVNLPWIRPFQATVLSIVFFILKLTFYCMIVFLINRICKKHPFGFVGGIVLCFIDSIAFFDLLIAENPIWIFPFEYSFLESLLTHTSSMVINILISISYWISLYMVIGTIIFLLNRASGKKKLENKLYETDNI